MRFAQPTPAKNPKREGIVRFLRDAPPQFHVPSPCAAPMTSSREAMKAARVSLYGDNLHRARRRCVTVAQMARWAARRVQPVDSKQNRAPATSPISNQRESTESWKRNALHLSRVRRDWLVGRIQRLPARRSTSATEACDEAVEVDLSLSTQFRCSGLVKKGVADFASCPLGAHRFWTGCVKGRFSTKA